MGFLFGLLFDAAVIGLIIARMEGTGFPGWAEMIGVVFAMGIVSAGVAHVLPEGYWTLLGVVAGAATGAFMIAWLCEMTFRRAAVAAGIYLCLRLLIALAFLTLVHA